MSAGSRANSRTLWHSNDRLGMQTGINLLRPGCKIAVRLASLCSTDLPALPTNRILPVSWRGYATRDGCWPSPLPLR